MKLEWSAKHNFRTFWPSHGHSLEVMMRLLPSSLNGRPLPQNVQATDWLIGFLPKSPSFPHGQYKCHVCFGQGKLSAHPLGTLRQHCSTYVHINALHVSSSRC